MEDTDKKWNQKQKPTGRKRLSNIQKLERIVNMEIDALFKKATEHKKGNGQPLSNDEVSRLERLIKSQQNMDERNKSLQQIEDDTEDEFAGKSPAEIRAAMKKLQAEEQALAERAV